jgi:hypothetical protein
LRNNFSSSWTVGLRDVGATDKTQPHLLRWINVWL